MRTYPPQLRKLTLALLTASLAGAAFAAAPAEPAVQCRDLGAEGQVAHAAEWICSVAEVVNRLKLFTWMDGIAWAVLVTIFVARILSISLDTNPGPKLRNHLIASFLAFGLMLSLTPIRSAMLDVWKVSYTYSQSQGADAVWHTLALLAESLNAEDVAATLTGLAIADQIGEPVFDIVDEGQAAGSTALVGVAGAAANRIGKLNSIARGLSQAGEFLKKVPIFRIIDAILMPVMALYSMTVFGSALTIIIGAFLLPVGAAMIAAGAANSFFSRWSNVMIGSIITMVVFPLMWGVTTQVAFVTPLTNFLGGLGDMVVEYNRTITEIANRPSSINPFEMIGGQLEMMYASFGAGANFLGGLMTMVVQMAIGLITAIGLIFLLQKIVSQFIGGIAVQGQGLIQALGVGGLLGGSRNGKSSEPKSTQQQQTRAPQAGGGHSSGGGTGRTATATSTAADTGSAAAQESGLRNPDMNPLPHYADDPGEPHRVGPIVASTDATNSGSGRLLN